MSKYIYGIHEPSIEHIMEEQGTIGWITFTHQLRLDGDGGFNYQPWTDRGFGIIARLNHGYGTQGTIPHPKDYGRFAARCARWVRNSVSGAPIVWIVGNEPGNKVEQPDGEPITPEMYTLCFNLCHEAMKEQMKIRGDLIAPAAIGPWNSETADWLEYFSYVMTHTKPTAIALHTYTHGTDPGLIFSEQTMNPPNQHRRYHFRAYRDFMERIPDDKRHLPIFITETCQLDPWANTNSGWVKNAYQDINDWNQSGQDRIVHALVLYRGPKIDKWYIEGKNGVIQDWAESMAHKYTWEKKPEPVSRFTCPNCGHLLEVKAV